MPYRSKSWTILSVAVVGLSVSGLVALIGAPRFARPAATTGKPERYIVIVDSTAADSDAVAAAHGVVPEFV
jgi:hypothetical protein